MTKTILGMEDDAIIGAVRGFHPNIAGCKVVRGIPSKTGRYTSINLTITAPQTQMNLIERRYPPKDRELFNYGFAARHTLSVPRIFHIDAEKGVLLMEDLNEDYIQGSHFNEDGERGAFVRENHSAILRAAAKFHASFWDNYAAFGEIGLDRRLENRENLLAHINGMEKDFRKYRAAEKKGEIPKVWNGLENNIKPEELDYFQAAIEKLREQYVFLIGERFMAGKNITVIHGDLHPGNFFISKTHGAVKFIDMEAVRMGICTEDLAMLLALHIEPDEERALSLLRYYHNCLSETVEDYSFEQLLSDYQISIMENMFFTIRLINRGICDFSMRDRALRAFETFVISAP